MKKKQIVATPIAAKPMTEFHDLSEKILNTGDQYWGNLGYWQPDDDYSTACKGLANQLAVAASLNTNSRVLDVGFGCGDQLLLWLDEYHIESLCGINYSFSQTTVAQQRLVINGYLEAADNIHCADVGKLLALPQLKAANLNQINTVLALDCAYHFPSREQFVRDSFTLLKESNNSQPKRIVLTDIVLAKDFNQLSGLKKALLKGMLWLSRIPQNNIVTEKNSIKKLYDIGFKQVNSEDISESVFLPFGAWLASEENRIKAAASTRSIWLKYKVTTTFLAWAYRKNVLRYVVLTAKLE